jgi:hypothetical protein
MNEEILKNILEASQKESLPIIGLLREWSFCQHLWAFFKQMGVIQKEILAGKEVLYSVDLNNRILTGDLHVRFLTIEDYEEWKLLSFEYLEEMGLVQDLTDK